MLRIDQPLAGGHIVENTLDQLAVALGYAVGILTPGTGTAGAKSIGRVGRFMRTYRAVA